MASNPMFGNRTSPTGAITPGNPLNDSNKRYSQSYNKFGYGRKLFKTSRYAEVSPFEVIRGVEGDKIPLFNKSKLRTFTLKSQMLSKIHQRKSYFMTDMRAILPKNWDKWYKQPAIGDDVSDDVGTAVTNFFYLLELRRQAVANVAYGLAVGDYVRLTILFRELFFYESIFSTGSLLPSLGLNSHAVFYYTYSNELRDFDHVFDSIMTYFEPLGFVYKINDRLYIPEGTPRSSSSGYTAIPFRQIVDLMRNHPDFEILTITHDEDSEEFWNLIQSRFYLLGFNAFAIKSIKEPINLDVLYAYQIVCAQFFTNPNVDYIYSAELYRDNLLSLHRDSWNKFVTDQDYENFMTFDYNGISCDYDICSGNCLNKLLGFVSPTILYQAASDLGVSVTDSFYGYLHNIFSYQRSLRYGDYFTGSKTRPLAVGDVSVTVSNGAVSAIDITRNVMKQRFLNAVGRIRNTMSDYLKDVMDGVQPPRDDEPRFLASEMSVVSGFEVENTAENQGNIVTILKSQNSNYAYEVSVGSPCIILGLESFEVQRVYSRTIDRFFFHSNRMDMFNKFMQYIGDQKIYRLEHNADSANNIDSEFAYTLRHMEYKQRFPIAVGGFVNALNSWLMVTDSRVGYNFMDVQNLLSPEYIRNKNYELDRFYESLTGYSMGTYFHFIEEFDNICDIRRQMAYSPSIL